MNLKTTRAALGLIAILSFIAGFAITPTAGALEPAPTVPIITTIAGTGTKGYGGDNGPATDAQINYPIGVAVDSAGNVYVVDSRNNRIRKIDTDGTITTIAGTGTGTYGGFSGDNGPATDAQIAHSQGVAVDKADNIYLADAENLRIRKIDTNGVITTIAGNGTYGFSGDGGLATDAAMRAPQGIAVDSAGIVYFSDYFNQRIRKIDTNGIITTVAGTGTGGYSGDNGPATAAQINYPYGLATDSADNLYFADESNHRIRKIDTDGIITTVAGTGTGGYSGDNGPATAAQINSPVAVVVDNSGNIYIAGWDSRIRKVDTTGTIITIGGNGIDGFSGDNGPAADAQISPTLGIAVDNAGNVYFSDPYNQRIRLITMPDTTAPVVTITTPTTDIKVGATLKANFTCTDTGGSGLASCAATLNGVAITNNATINTTTTGAKKLTVTATDGAGNTTVKAITVTVIKAAAAVCPRLITGDFANGTGNNGSVSRIYMATFKRQPDAGGHTYWVTQSTSTMTISEIADFFTDSTEFRSTYANLDNAGFVKLLYTNVMCRPSDTEGQGYWTNLLNTDVLTRAGVTLWFAESPEFKTLTKTS